MSVAEETAWARRATALAARRTGDDLADPAALMLRLAELDRLVRLEAPDRVRGAFVRLGESELHAAAEARVAQIERGAAGWGAAPADDPLDILRPVAVEIRATDTLLRRTRAREVPANPGKEWRVGSGVRASLVVPYHEWSPGRTADGQPYERRGLREHRILPARIGQHRVRLVVPGDARQRVWRKGAFRAAGALFEELEVVLANRKPGLFIVKRAHAPDRKAQIDGHLVGAQTSAATALVWPELTMPREDRKRVRRYLARRLAGPEAGEPAMAFVVAGSWHERAGRRFVNRSVVYDGFGGKLVTFDKGQAFQHAKYGTEDIDESPDITVLLLEDRLIGLGICKDFCNIHAANPYPQLDLDYFVVPSMGNATTTEGHIITARLVRTRYDARTLVVQQSDPDDETQLGYVVPPVDDLAGVEAAGCVQEGTLALYDA